MRKLKHDIYFLQESHLLEKDENFIRSAWGYNCFLAGNSKSKKGVAILFNNSFEYKIHNIIRDKEGCYLILDVTLLGKRLTLCNLYGPSEGDRPQFFENVFNIIKQTGNEEKIIAGDFNLVMNPLLDLKNYKNYNKKPNSKRILNNFISELDLIDIYREIYPEKKTYTWRRFNSNQQGRLDFFLITDTLISEINGVNNFSGYRSDHTLVNLQLRKGHREKSRQFWKFNNSLLKDKVYVEEIKKLINNVKKQYSLLVYNHENIENINDEEVEFLINDQLFFETLLMEIRGKSISYASFKKKKETEEENKLIVDIQELENKSELLSNEEIIILEQKKEELTTLRNQKLQGMIIRSKMVWINEGEKPTSYFCNLEKRNFVSKQINFLEKSNGDLIFENKEIIEETKNFYENLYDFKDTEDIELNNIIKNPIKLTLEESETLEGKITYEEALHALKEMKNNKSPGSDGFSCEFFKFFYKDLGHFLVRSLNYGFNNGSLSITQRQGIITCIPKDNKPKHFLKNWRPISLLNVTYKIATTCISNRLKSGILEKLIHQDQKGFLSSRYIGENIRQVYDILNYTSKHNISGLLLFVDFEKAFDSIAWSFIFKVLRFLNFGEEFINWIKIFYKDIISCVSVNGSLSSWFKIQRGVRQGDPLSPYLYLLCAEMLSNMIRENENIKGLQLKNSLTLLSQFADDTALCLDGTEKSFTEAVDTLTFFARLSGLKVNVEKTQAVWLGNNRGRGIRYMRDKNFIWDPGTFRYLGIIFSTQVKEIVRLNFENKIHEIQKLLQTWNKRQLTPFGKITLIKTLGVSKLTYLFANIPDPNENFLQQLDTLFFNFLWNNKVGKLNKKCTFKPILEGGLNMLNVYSFLSAMKINWIKRMIQNDNSYKEFVLDLYPKVGNIKLFGAEYTHSLRQNIDNDFWSDVFKHYHKLSLKCLPRNINEFFAESLFFNINITVGRHVIYIKNWMDNGVNKIHHLYKDENTILTYNEFRLKYTHIQSNFLHYQGIVAAITSFRRRMDPTFTGHGVNDLPCILNVIQLGSKFVRNILDHNILKPPGQLKWDTSFENLNWKAIYYVCHKTTIECQLKWFQLRILYKALPTNRYLFFRRIVDNANCTFCKNAEETITHLFWYCPQVQMFWNDFITLLTDNCTHIYNLTMSEELVIFGVKNKVKTDKIFNFILLSAKYYIYCCKFKENIPNIAVFKKILYNRYLVEKYRFSVSNRYTVFINLWNSYQTLISSIC